MERRRFTALDFDDLIYGIHAVDEALAGAEDVRAIHIAADRAKDGALRPVIAKARAAKVPLRFEPRAFFEKIPLRAHQGVIAVTASFAYVSLHDILARSRRDGAPRLIVILDHLTDPYNVGAVIRTVEAAGGDGVVLPARRSAGINATVRKAAAGAAAHLPIARVPNIAAALRELKKSGVWIVGADPAEPAVEVNRADLNRDLALVIGAEGAGLSTLVKRECDYLIRLPIRGRVASLNASVAAGILIYEALRQQDCSLRP